MDLFGIGIPEILFVVVIAMIILGPRDIVKAGRTIGRVLNSVVRSETWQSITYMWRETRTLPNKLMREAGLEEASLKGKNIGSDLKMDALRKDLQQWKSDISDWTSPTTTSSPAAVEVKTDPAQPAEETPQPNQDISANTD